jgi:peptidoglycan/LPS O-acetylase OafA/YrhL
MTIAPPSGEAHVRYRADVDGLRAIAVLAVIGYHAAPHVVRGGFIGVDVFFVISGFLISGILFAETARGQLDLYGFYARRIRRIFPALAIVLVACGTFGWIALVKEDYLQLQKHIAGGAFFVSNFILFGEAGYFDTPSQFKPLLHLWSLGIEEQFYLVWPPLLYLCWRRRLNVGTAAAAIVALSFMSNVALTGRHALAAFYLPATRMWELLIGAWLASTQGFGAAERIADRSNRNAAFGLALILVATFALDGTHYPGWAALLPTIGAAAIISAGPAAWVNRRLLAGSPVVYIGLISYPLYLWHWPLLSFLHITEGGNPSRAVRLYAIGLAFVLAALTYHLVERPIRRTVSAATPGRVATLVVLLLAIGSLSGYGASTSAFTPRVPYLVGGVYSKIPSPRGDRACESRFPSGGEYCQATGPNVTTALLGDSHAEHFLVGVAARLARRGEDVVHLGHSGCPPLLDVERIAPGTTDQCRQAGNSVIEHVVNNPTLRRVVIAFKGAVYVTGRGWDVDDAVFRIAGTELTPEESMRVALERTVRRLIDNGKEIWILQQVPELRFNITECFPRPFSFEKTIRTPCAVAKAAMAARQVGYRRIVEAVARTVPAVHVFDPAAFLCDERWCYAVIDKTLLYADDNHLSREGSLFFADKFPF